MPIQMRFSENHTAVRRREEICSQLRAAETKPLPQMSICGAEMPVQEQGQL